MKVLGFELSEMKFSSLSTKSLMSTSPHYPYRRSRIIAYQAAMLIGLAAECTATYSLSKYEDLQENVERWFSDQRAHLYQNDIIDTQIVTIVFCVITACIFGADFFFLAMFPRQVYPRWYDNARRVAAVVTSLGMFAAAFGSAIVVARNSAVVSGVTEQDVVAVFQRPPFQYNQWDVNIAYVVLLWIATIGVFISTVYMFLAIDHEHKFGHPAIHSEKLHTIETDTAALASSREPSIV